MPPKANRTVSRGGFTGLPSQVVTNEPTTAAEETRRNRAVVERDLRGLQESEAAILKLANVNLEGWEGEKEVRVKTAFDRILHHGWYDKLESNLKAMELIHVNAVREHFAMRRDRIQTPSLIAGKRTNTMEALEWADNVNSINDLKATTNLRDNFMQFVSKKAEQRKRHQQNHFHSTF
jgi:hypothetical protein